MSVVLLLFTLISLVIAAPSCDQVVHCKFDTVNLKDVSTTSGSTVAQCQGGCESLGVGKCKAWQVLGDGTCIKTNDAALTAVVYDATVTSGGCNAGAQGKLTCGIPVNCALSAWSDSSSCSVTCGPGTKSQIRSIITQPANGGTPCGPTSQTVSCNRGSCPLPVNCVLSAWSDSSSCSVTCGQGTKSQIRSIITQPANGGASCGPTSQTVSCNQGTCPVPGDCVLSAWSDSSSCSVTCGPGTKTQTRTIVTRPTNGGTPCGSTTQTVSCNQGNCPLPVDCVLSEWSDSSSCSVKCGPGTKSQTRTIVTQPANGGTGCGVLSQTVSCVGIDCPVTPSK